MRLVPHPFSLRQLQYAAAVAQTLSFRRAAERCHVSQPSLSAQVAELEFVLGFRLFERNRRQVLVTPAGKHFIEKAHRVLLAADELLQDLRLAGDEPAGTLRLGIIPTISLYLLPRATPLLRRGFRKLTVVWLEDKTHVLMNALRAGEIEAAVVALEAELGEVDGEVLAEDEFFLAAPRGHPLASKNAPVRLKDLRGTDVLLLDEGHCLRKQALELCAAAEGRELEFRATSLPTLTQMVAAGLGVTLLPALAIPTEARYAKLVVRAFAPPAPRRTLALVWRPQSALVEPLRKVAAVLREACRAVISRNRARRINNRLSRRA